jgi:rod shape-determining protein MreC
VPRNRSSSAVLDATVSRPRPQPFPTRSRSALRRRAVVATLVVLSLVLITVSFRQPTSGALSGIESAGVTVLRPFEVAAERIARPFRDVYGYFSGLVHAKSENARLRREIDDLRQVAIQNQTAQEQYATLRKQLHYVDSPRFPADYTAVNTRIIARAPSEFDQRVLIAAGTSDGIKLETPVVTQDGLVGTVTKVSSSAAEVTLITDEESAVQARDLQTHAIGLIRHGQSPGQLILDRVGKDQDVREGDVIITAGTQSKQYPSLFPMGIQIGKVVSVGQTDTAYFKTIQVQPYVTFGSLDSVTALVSNKRVPVAP